MKLLAHRQEVLHEGNAHRATEKPDSLEIGGEGKDIMGRLSAPVFTTSRMIAPTIALKARARPMAMNHCEVQKFAPDHAEVR